MPEIFDIRILSVQDFYLSKQEIVSRFQEKIYAGLLMEYLLNFYNYITMFEPNFHV